MVPLLTFVFSRAGIRAGARRAHGRSRRRPRRFSSRRSPRCASISGIARSCGRWSPDSRPASSRARSSGRRSSARMSTALLSAFFGVFVAAAATNIWIDRQPKPTHKLPGRGGLIAVGSGIGLIASMVGAGGAFMTVPFMTACNVPMRNCVATSAALGLPVAAAATIGFVIAGLGQTGTAAAHDRLCALAGAVRDRRGERDLRAVRRARGPPLAGQDAEAGVRVRAVRARGLHAVASLAVEHGDARSAADVARAASGFRESLARAGSSGPCPSRCAAAPSRTARASEP